MITGPLDLEDVIRQWLNTDPDMANWSLKRTNRLWFSCRCKHHGSLTPPGTGLFPVACVWADCVQVIVVSGYKSYDLWPESPDFFDQLKEALLNSCK